MSRLSIEVTPEQHQQLKAIAALHGQTLKDYILERTLPRLLPVESLFEEEALQRLETLMRPRLAEAERGEVVADSVEQIFAAARSDSRLLVDELLLAPMALDRMPAAEVANGRGLHVAGVFDRARG